MQEKQRRIQEAAPGSQEADPSGKAWEDSPWAPSVTRDVPATAQQAEPLAFKNAHLKKHFLRKLKHDAQANRLVTKAALNFLSAQFLKKNLDSLQKDM